MSRPTGEELLKGLRVIDLSRVLAGPYCAMTLADYGAEVVKVESPNGDDTRTWGPPFIKDESSYFLSINRGKRSVSLDLSTDSGHEQLAALMANADVIIENFRPSSRQRLGLDPEQLLSKFPQMIICSIVGFAPGTGWAEFPGYDPVIEGMSGLMDINGPRGRDEPYKVGVAIIDVLAATQATTAILAALHRRDSGHGGTHIQIPLMDVACNSLVNVAQAALVLETRPVRHGNDHPNIVPFGVFPTKEGKVVLCVGSNVQWNRFCEVIGVPADEIRGLENNQARVNQRARVREVIEKYFENRSADDWSEILMSNGVPCGPISNIHQALTSTYAAESGLVTEIDHTTIGAYRAVCTPAIVNNRRAVSNLPPPVLGEANDVVQEAQTNGVDAWGQLFS